MATRACWTASHVVDWEKAATAIRWSVMWEAARGVGTLDESEQLIGKLGVVVNGSSKAGRVVRKGGLHGDSELTNGTV